MKLEHLTSEAISAAITVHSELGPGLLENAYRKCVFHELICRGLKVESERAIPISYRGVQIDVGDRTDLLLEGQVILELKAVPNLLPIHRAQLLSQLRLGRFSVGLLINFHVERLKDGITRLVT